jgi:SAM-dependent methyltransferase
VRAEETGLPAASVDAVTAGQCWHWFDRPRAGAEARRLLKSGGAIVIAHFDWIPLSGNVVDATEHLIERHNPTWKLGGAIGLYPQWVHDVDVAGFQHIETFSYDVTVPYTHLAWRGRVRASAGVGASLPADKVREFDRALAEMLAAQFPFDPLEVPHRVFAVVARSPGQAGG